MIGQLTTAVLDAADPVALASFYRELTGWRTDYTSDDFVVIADVAGIRLGFQRSPEHRPPRWPDPAFPQQAHLDLQVPDMTAATELATKLGAQQLGGGETWRTVADPAGHPLDLCHNPSGERVTLFAFTLDCPDAKALSEFYAQLLGMQIRYSGDEGALIGADGVGQVMFQQVSEYLAPRWPDPTHPAQLHLDLQVTDLDAAEAAALALGSVKLPSPAQGWRVFADPIGHPFCLVTEGS